MRGLRGRRPRGRPRKTLAELVREGSFLARRHDGLLAGDDVEDPTLAALQALYGQVGDDRQRRRVALRFEKICRAVPQLRWAGRTLRRTSSLSSSSTFRSMLRSRMPR